MRANGKSTKHPASSDFPSFSEGLSLRASVRAANRFRRLDFPSFSEGLSLRDQADAFAQKIPVISLPFRRDFH